jgi:hypothetical protein
MPRRWRGFLTAVVAVLLGLFPFALLQGQAFFERDISSLWAPQVEALVRAVHAGSWPVWDPTMSFGQPLLANPNNQLFYPTTWLNLIMPREAQYTVYVVLHLLLAALGLYRLAKRLGLQPAGAVTAACVFIASGPVLSLVNAWNHLAGLAWMPWVILAAERALEKPTWARLAAWGSAVALQVLTGSPDLVFYTHVVVAVEILRQLDRRAPIGRANLRRLGAALLAYALAAGLSAAQWLPTLDLARGTGRAHVSEQHLTVWSLHPYALLQVLLPVSFENLPRLGADSESVDRLHDLWKPFLRSDHLGLVAFLLVAAAVAGPPRRGRRGLVALGALGLLMALGEHTPVYAWIARAVPPLGLLRFPSKALVLTVLAWALLAGLGVEAWADETWRRRWLPVAAFAAALAAAAFATLVSFLPSDSPSPLVALRMGKGGAPWAAVAWDSQGSLIAATLAGVAALAVLAVCRKGLRARTAVALGVVAVAQLVITNRSVNATADRTIVHYHPPLLDVLRETPGRATPPRLYVWDYTVQIPGWSHPTPGMLAVLLDTTGPFPPRVADFMAMTSYLYPPTFRKWGLAGSYELDALGLYPPSLSRMTRAVRMMEDKPGYLRLLQLGGVDYVVALHADGQYGLEPVATVPGFYRAPIRVFRVPGTLPRAYVVACARSTTNTEAASRLLAPDFDATREIVLVDEPGGPCDPSFSGTVRIVDFRPDRVTLEADLTAPGWVVLLDSYDPRWRARVDGAEMPIHAANLIFRAVAVPAGRHRVEMVYRPRAVLAGLALSLATLVALGLAAGVRRRRG